MHRAPTRVALLLLTALAAGCGGSQNAASRVRPFPSRLLRVFDDAVDYVETVEGLGGRVATDWQAQIDGLSRAADVVATAHVETVMVETDPDGGRSYRLTVSLTDPLRGTLPVEHRANLRVTEGQVGYRTVSGREGRLQTMQFVAFIRWYRDAAGLVRAHWHLSPMTDAVVARVRSATGHDDQQLGVERIVRQDPAPGSEQSE